MYRSEITTIALLGTGTVCGAVTVVAWQGNIDWKDWIGIGTAILTPIITLIGVLVAIRNVDRTLAEQQRQTTESLAREASERKKLAKVELISLPLLLHEITTHCVEVVYELVPYLHHLRYDFAKPIEIDVPDPLPQSVPERLGRIVRHQAPQLQDAALSIGADIQTCSSRLYRFIDETAGRKVDRSYGNSGQKLEQLERIIADYVVLHSRCVALFEISRGRPVEDFKNLFPESDHIVESLRSCGVHDKQNIRESVFLRFPKSES
ncbi:hypothetical protein [Thalassospira indica]|uniref:Uncharacterized protein n=1 Tax=Thalassospira indica TaxID=1891279 RepID=A0ABM6XX71_9PROT|nr:hypothetical protein [Thalassospira indica]AXO14234.1 hypothetical protein DY252_08330 [Thalassospira indica]OAZ12287.1 hypothetical protein TH15_17015 [Thalassospira profundimaris]